MRILIVLRHGCNNATKCSRRQRRWQSSQAVLQAPRIVYSDNHLLVVDKPVGWNTVVDLNSTPSTDKCLLTHLKGLQLGGGSRKDFLLPLHRIDQPCSGLLLFGKTTKAASRITKLWKDVVKTYLCILQPASTSSNSTTSTATATATATAISRLQQASKKTSSNGDWWILQGYIIPPKRSNEKQSNKIPPRGWSVQIVPVTSDNPSQQQQQQHSKQQRSHRCVSLEWQYLQPPSLLQVRTTMGSRHMIRALLAQVGQSPILGDVRYQSHHVDNENAPPLYDASVALHARSLRLPSHLQLGSSTMDHPYFVAPIPKTWYSFLPQFWNTPMMLSEAQLVAFEQDSH